MPNNITQLPLSFEEVYIEDCPTAEAESRYILRSMQRGQSIYQRRTSFGLFEARRLPGKKGGKQGKENLWAIFFRPDKL